MKLGDIAMISPFVKRDKRKTIKKEKRREIFYL
jgi:hypothetical protein